MKVCLAGVVMKQIQQSKTFRQITRNQALRYRRRKFLVFVGGGWAIAWPSWNTQRFYIEGWAAPISGTRIKEFYLLPKR